MSPTRRQRGEGSVFKRADGRWVGRVDLGVVNGTRKRKTVYAKTQREAVAKLREARKKVDAGDTNTAGTSLEKWLTYWLDEVCPGKPRMKPKTLRDYRSKVEQYLIPTMDATTNAADPRVILAIDAEIAKANASGERWSANDIRSRLPVSHGPLVGARVRAAATRRPREQVRIGYVPSSLASTHAHPIAEWIGAEWLRPVGELAS